MTINSISSIDIMCLQNVLNDNNRSLQPDCYKMLTSRIEMFRNVAKVTNLLDLTDTLIIDFFIFY